MGIRLPYDGQILSLIGTIQRIEITTRRLEIESYGVRNVLEVSPECCIIRDRRPRDLTELRPGDRGLFTCGWKDGGLQARAIDVARLPCARPTEPQSRFMAG